MKFKVFVIAFPLFFLSEMSSMGGSIDSPVPPGDPGSAMYTLEAIYNRLNSGELGSKRSGSFTEPSSAVGSTGHTLDDVMGKAPSPDNTNGARPGDVRQGKTFWGITNDSWGLKTGTNALVVSCSGTLHGTRWCDNGDNTVTDMTTGLIWEKNARGSAKYYWRYASYALGRENVFRLPEKSELIHIFSAPDAVSLSNMQAFVNVGSDYYWTGESWSVSEMYIVKYNGACTCADLNNQNIIYHFWGVKSPF